MFLLLAAAFAFMPRPATRPAMLSRPSQRAARLAVAPRLGLLGWVEDKIYFQLAKRRWDEQLAKRPSRIILVRVRPRVRAGQAQGWGCCRG